MRHWLIFSLTRPLKAQMPSTLPNLNKKEKTRAGGGNEKGGQDFAVPNNAYLCANRKMPAQALGQLHLLPPSSFLGWGKPTFSMSQKTLTESNIGGVADMPERCQTLLPRLVSDALAGACSVYNVTGSNSGEPVTMCCIGYTCWQQRSIS